MASESDTGVGTARPADGMNGMKRHPIATLPGYEGARMYLGDIHNHCGISYGHGSIEDAYANAKLQLDFASVTGHAWWHDMPREYPEMAKAVAYHEAGFARLAEGWEHVQDVTTAAAEDGRFVSMLSFEWHSRRYGDHCIYYKGTRGDIIRAGSLEEMRDELRARAARGVEMMALPHHLGYKRGYRGANWSTFTPEFTPVAEMMSMHGASESDEGPRPYLHGMGPRCADSSALAGLAQGHRFGFIGSTDHHSAHPGSFGQGRVAAWAPELTMDGIWGAFQRRQVYALTGDPITVAFSVNDAPMGAETPLTRTRRIRAQVSAQAPIDYLEVLRNGVPIHRLSRTELLGAPRGADFVGTVGISVGWGPQGNLTPWEVRLRVEGGELTDVVTRLRGEDILEPSATPPDSYHFSQWQRVGEHEVALRTVTHANANNVTDGTQGLVLHLRGDDATRIMGTVNDQPIDLTVGRLREGAVTGYLKEYVTPAWRFDRAVPEQELTAELDIEDESPTPDWYYLRVRQTNDQWAWSSPIWVG